MTNGAFLDQRAAALVLDDRSVWTCDEVAAYLKVSRRKVDLLRKTADFPKSASLGGHPRYRAGNIMQWFERKMA